jgi:hypothetical protein
VFDVTYGFPESLGSYIGKYPATRSQNYHCPFLAVSCMTYESITKSSETQQARLGIKAGCYPEISANLPANMLFQTVLRLKQTCTSSHL